MPTEYVGTCGRGRPADRAAAAADLEFGIACLRRCCGREPSGCSLEVVWHDHDIAAYPTISLVSAHGSFLPEHWDYIERCAVALDRLDECIDWNALNAARRDVVSDTSLAMAGRWMVPAFCGFCLGFWLMFIIGQPSLWWVPLMSVAMFVVPMVAWRAWESWDETKSLLSSSEYRNWVLGIGPRKTSRRNRVGPWWKHFTGGRE